MKKKCFKIRTATMFLRSHFSP